VSFGVIDAEPKAIDRLRESLQWVDFLPLSVPDPIGAARIDTELHDAGEQFTLCETIMAGGARNRGPTLVAADDHFRGIDGLEVVNYRL
jgi:predicted nucleic acid-binding protein